MTSHATKESSETKQERSCQEAEGEFRASSNYLTMLEQWYSYSASFKACCDLSGCWSNIIIMQVADEWVLQTTTCKFIFEPWYVLLYELKRELFSLSLLNLVSCPPWGLLNTCSKTFGLKNKNKSAKVQQFVQQVQKTANNQEKAKQEANAAKKVPWCYDKACNHVSHNRIKTDLCLYRQFPSTRQCSNEGKSHTLRCL